MHLSDQTAKFKAFKINEMNAISDILAECEFVCTHKDCGFPFEVPAEVPPVPLLPLQVSLSFDIFVTRLRARMHILIAAREIRFDSPH